MALPKLGAKVSVRGIVVGVNDHTNPALHHVRVQLKDGQSIATHPDNLLADVEPEPIEEPKEVEVVAKPKPVETTAHTAPLETTARKGPLAKPQALRSKPKAVKR